MTKAQASKRLQRIIDSLNELQQEMQDYYDEKTEKWQDGEKGEEYQAMMEGIEAAAMDLENLQGE